MLTIKKTKRFRRGLFAPLLIAFFILSCFIGLYQIPTVSAAPTEINLPYTISTAGSYVITAEDSTIAGVALTINADNVYVDGGNFLQTQTDNNNFIYSSGHTNITLVNFNQDRTAPGTNPQRGIYLIDITDSIIANSTFRKNYDNYIYGDSSNYLVSGVLFEDTVFHAFKTYGVGEYNHNFTIRDSIALNTGVSGAGFGFTSQECSDFTWSNLTSINTGGTTGSYGFITDGYNYDYRILNCNSTNDYRGLQLLGARNVLVDQFTVTNPDNNVAINCDNASNVIIKRGNYTVAGAAGNVIQLTNSATVCDNITIQQNKITNGLFQIYTANGNNINYVLNYHTGTYTRPIYEAAGENHIALHNYYEGNSSANVIMTTGRFVNDSTIALTVSQVGSGTVSPVVGVHVVDARNWSVPITATPDAHFALTSIEFGGVELGVSATLAEMLTDAPLQFTFDEYEFEVTPTANTHTTITPNSAAYYAVGSNQQFTYSAATGYHISEVLVDGTPVSIVTYPSSYTFNDIQDSHTIEVSAEINTYTITAIQGSNGAITPSGVTTKNYGEYQAYNITANTHYHITDVLVDGYSIGVTSTANFTNIQANHNITATFSIDTYNITVIQGSNGALAPSGVLVKDYGDNQTITITPTLGYHISDVLVDAVSVGAVSNYTFTTIEANHNITATFESDVYPSPPPTATPTPTPTTEPTATTFDIEAILTALFFGDVWYFGFMIWLIVALLIMKLWRYGGAIIIPLSIIFEAKYYEAYLAGSAELVWAMVFLGALVLLTLVYTVSVLGKQRSDKD